MVQSDMAGFVGAMKGIAPGRFAAAINQPPVQRRLGLLPLDSIINRIAMWRSNAGPARVASTAKAASN